MDAEESEEVKPECFGGCEEIQPEYGKCRRKTFKFKVQFKVKK